MNKDFKKKLNLFYDILSQSKYGKISVFHKSKKIFFFESTNTGPNAEIIIVNEKCLDDLFWRGDLGWAESYISENWDTPNLSVFLEWGAKKFHEFTKYIRGKWHTIFFLRLKHYFNRNSRLGSIKNVSFHYDLGNNFYKYWLDKSMTYSSALFKNSKDDLYDAQINKYKNLSKLCNIKKDEEILEIGCGWGGFAIFLAKNYSAKVTAITISKKQFELVKKRVFDEKLDEKINVELIDYRDVKGMYDKIVSIEMFEAVGEKYWPTYFDILKKKLKQNGSIGLQTITIENSFFRAYRKFPDFIQTYIFPGGMLPSVEEMKKVALSNGLMIQKQIMFGKDYAKTLKHWMFSFENSWEKIRGMGYNNAFRRMWKYYLSYCEGGFKSGNINVGQFLIKKT